MGALLALQLLVLLAGVVGGDRCPDLLRGCVDREPGEVVCHGANFTDAGVFHCIGERYRGTGAVTAVSVTGNSIRELPRDLFGPCGGGNASGEPPFSSLATLRLSGNGIEEIHGGAFGCLPGLRTLVLSDNDWAARDGGAVFGALPALTTLDLRNALTEWVDARDRTHFVRLSWALNRTGENLEDLNLAENDIVVLTAAAMDAICRLSLLKRLNLSNNFISAIDLENCSSRLEELDLSSNDLPLLSDGLLAALGSMTALRNLSLGRNKFACDCQLRNFYSWLKSTDIVKDKDSIVCYSGYHSSYVNRTLLSLSLSDLKCRKANMHKRLQTSYIIIGVIFALLACIMMAVLYLNRAGIKRVSKRCLAPFRMNYMPPHAHYSYASIDI